MITKKQLIITQYLKMNYDLKHYIHQNIFPDFYDVVDILFYFILFYFQYNFMMVEHTAEKIEDLLLIHNIVLDDERFGKVCDITIDFLKLINRL